MKILYCSDAKLPGKSANGIQVIQMCQAFAENGHEVVLTTYQYTNENMTPDRIFLYYGVKEKFLIYICNIRKTKLRHFEYSKRVSEFIHEFRPDIVYGRSQSLYLMVKSYKIGAVVFEAHAPVSDINKLFGWYFKKLIQLKNFNRLIVITNELKKYYMSKYNIDEDKICVAADGANQVPNDIKPTQLFSCAECNHNVGYIGSMKSGKGMELIVKILPLCPDILFHIIGGNDEEIAYWAAQCIGYKNIHFYGFIPHSETVSYGIAMDILIQPCQKSIITLTDIAQWTSPLKLFEYMSYGKPIICSDLPVLREVMTHGYNGIMCDPDDAVQWRDSIYLLLNEKNMACRLAENAKKTFLQNYTWKIRGKNVLRGMDKNQ